MIQRLYPAIFLLFGFIFLTLLAGCSDDPEKKEPPEVVLMTHDSFNVSVPVIEMFENRYQCKLSVLKSGDAGEALNKAILAGENPVADVFFGVDNTFLSRAIDEDIFIPYASPQLADIDDSLKLDVENRLLPVDYGDVCLNYDKKWFAERSISPPESLEDLVNPELKGLLVVQNPATSSPGLAFLLATIGRFGESGYLDFWLKLKQNDVLITNGWNDAYWGKFSAASDGSRPIVVSYASSPAAEVYFSKEKLETAPTAAVIDNGSAFRQIEFAGILKGTRQLELSKHLVDFLLSRPFQLSIFL